MNCIETHIVKSLTARIRIQEYGPLVFQTLPTRSSVKKAIKKGLVFIDGEKADTSDWIETGQKLEVFQEDVTEKTFNFKLKVLFQDEHLAVIEKPSGYPTSGNYFKTIENALPFNLKPSELIDALPKPQPVHRLDNPTSGVLLIAKTKSAQVHLNRQFQEKKVHKTYVAILHGSVSKDLIFSTKIENKSAETHLKLTGQVNRNKQNFSLVELFPKTGRTHQLRIHCSEAGFPIVGDSIYGENTSKVSLMLHASTVQFQHPETLKLLRTGAALPKRFKKFLNLS